MPVTEPDMLQTLGSLLTRAKVLEGDVDAVASAARLDRRTVSQLDLGVLAGWDTEAVGRLAECARVDPAAVWSGTVPSDRFAVYLFEKTWTDFLDSDRRTCLKALAFARVLKLLQQVVGEAARVDAVRKALPAPRDVRTAQAFRDGYQLASATRQALGLDASPVPSMLRMLPDKLGLPVVFADLQSGRLEGLTAVGEDAEAIVVNKKGFRVDTLRRLLAHELCHALFDPRDPDGNLAVLDRTEDFDAKKRVDRKRLKHPTPDAKERREQRARAFSAAFLVPEDGLIDLLGIPSRTRLPAKATERVARAMEHFDAPSGLVAWQLRNCGYIQESSVLPAASEADRVVGRRDSTERVHDPLRSLMDQALESGLISRGRAGELLRLARIA